MKKMLLVGLAAGASLSYGSGSSVFGMPTPQDETESRQSPSELMISSSYADSMGRYQEDIQQERNNHENVSSQMDARGGMPYRNTTVTSNVTVQGGGNDDKDVFQPTAGSLRFFNSKGYLFHTDDDDTWSGGEWDLVAMAAKSTEPNNLYLSAKYQGKENTTSDATKVTFSTASNSFVTVKDGKDATSYVGYIQSLEDKKIISYKWIISGNSLSLKATYTPYKLSDYSGSSGSRFGGGGSSGYATMTALAPQTITATVTFDASTKTVTLSNGGKLKTDETFYPKLTGTYIKNPGWAIEEELPDPTYTTGLKKTFGSGVLSQDDAPHLRFGVVKKGTNTICFQSNVHSYDTGDNGGWAYFQDSWLSETCVDYAWM